MKLTLSKKIFSLVAISFISFGTVFAQESESDEYEPAQVITEADDYTEIKEAADSKNSKQTKDKKKKSEHPVKDFFFGKEKYIYFDEMPLSTGTIGFSIKNRLAQTILNPETEMAGVQTYFQSAYFNILFDEKNRAYIADAVQKYLSDFENHKLERGKYMKTRKIYGNKGKCYVEWGTIKMMMDAYTHTTFTVGYEFKKVNDKESPYFCIIIRAGDNENEHMGTNTTKGTTEVELYFTKAQARQLADLLGRESIKGQLNEYYNIKASDEYQQAVKEDSDAY